MNNYYAWFLWIVGIYLISQAISRWREMEYNEGYAKGINESIEWSKTVGKNTTPDVLLQPKGE